jgi:hypothetical protein
MYGDFMYAKCLLLWFIEKHMLDKLSLHSFVGTDPNLILLLLALIIHVNKTSSNLKNSFLGT